MKTKESTTRKFLPYGRQHISQDDIDAVVEVLHSDWLTQGPTINLFERALADTIGAKEVVACATGTAALHLTMLALGIGEGDTVVTTPNTFLADANCARFVGAEVIFADIDPDTGNMSPDALSDVFRHNRERNIKAVIPVHFAGQPADIQRIHDLTTSIGAVVIDDACHALGSSYEYDGKLHKVGGSPHSTMTVFSFHPVKHVAMGEGGAVATNDAGLAEKLRLFRNHGMTKENFEIGDQAFSPSSQTNPWYYEMQQLGYNYRLTDIQAALGISQLKRLGWSVERRREIAGWYHELIDKHFDKDTVRPLEISPNVQHAWHLFVVRIDFEHFGVPRATAMNRLRTVGIGTQVHYIPVHLQPYYRKNTGTGPGDFPNAEAYYAQALSLPMYPDLDRQDIERVVNELCKALKATP